MTNEGSTQGRPAVAYFSMEVGFESGIPTYSGGLGVLAGDTLKAAADLSLPVTGVSLVHRKGYFRQSIGPRGAQREGPDVWRPEEHLDPVQSIGFRGETVLPGRCDEGPHRLGGPGGPVPGNPGRLVGALLVKRVHFLREGAPRQPRLQVSRWLAVDRSRAQHAPKDCPEKP